MVAFITALLHKDSAKTWNSNFLNIYCLHFRELRIAVQDKKEGEGILQNDSHFDREFHLLNKRNGYFSTDPFHKSN